MTTTYRWLCELLPSSFAVDKRSSSDGFNENNDDDDADDSVGYYVASWMRMHDVWLRRDPSLICREGDEKRTNNSNYCSSFLSEGSRMHGALTSEIS